jgi:CHAD domain-containing protein
MPPVVTPWEFAIEQRELVRQHWPGVRDADRESIHEARVAIRRIRAALGAFATPDVDAVKLCRSLGRALGRVRELDITDSVLDETGMRLPRAAHAVAAVRRDLSRNRLQASRRLVKTLDDLKLRPLARLARPHRGVLTFWKDWRTGLFDAIATRSEALRAAAHEAPAVYMPNRLHRVRIALKKLRYTLEVAEAAALPVEPALMRDLSKTQDSLGRIHDIHVAQRAVRALKSTDKDLDEESRLLDAVLGADRSALYTKYLARRDRVRAFSEYGATLITSRTRRRAAHVMARALPAAGLVVVPVAIWRLGALTTERSHP